MISLAQFYQAYTTFRPAPDQQQRQAIQRPPQDALFLVAGPGTGKTTCLTLRILKLILVDRVPPVGILATTFTKKAAEELRSRILGWGFRLLNVLDNDPHLPQAQKDAIKQVDINQVWTGTIDSLCEQLLRQFRAPGTQPPVVADDFVAKTLLLREGLLNGRRDQNTHLDQFLLGIHSANGSRFGYNAGGKNNLLQSIWDRRYQDQVAWPGFLGGGPPAQSAARAVVGNVLADYAAALRQKGMVDFSLLEHEVLQRLLAGSLAEFTNQLQVVLVDEYQDTNLLQERLYFELARCCGGALVVVGDDDQSLYRFRGATVQLFSDFASRYQSEFGHAPQTIFLSNNYRSTQTIIQFVNEYATLDADYQAVRVASKPPLAHGPAAAAGSPVLGMFRNTVANLASDLAAFLHAVFRGAGVAIPGGTTLSRAVPNGDVGDCALLSSSPQEFNYSGQARLPLLLRQQLDALSPPISVFNPRGEDLTGIPLVQRFGGLLLECLDLGGALEGQTSGLAPDAVNTFTIWRKAAISFTSGAGSPPGLLDYATGWADRDPRQSGYVWPKSVPVLRLIYGLVHYFPELHDDPEGQVYLEVFTRQLSACQQVGKFNARVVTDPANQGLNDASVKELLRDFLGPIAAGSVQVNEELIEAFPRDRLSVLSIHQSKGLEFPLTIVDVGSDFKDRRSPPFKRFPNDGSPSQRMEDLLRPHSPLGAPARTQVDRAFDDLYRQFFVAFSRPQDVLLLVGVRPTFPGGRVENIATGWDRSGTCHWAAPNTPLVEI
jgi:DNA helicase-2/ATP-dependent DNA helicase PcrA